jgi:hypothetical protein
VLIQIKFLCILFLSLSLSLFLSLSLSNTSYFLTLCPLHSTAYPLLLLLLLLLISSLPPTPLTLWSLLFSSVIYYLFLPSFSPSSFSPFTSLPFFSALYSSLLSIIFSPFFPSFLHTTPTNTGHLKTEKRTTNDSNERTS